MTVALMLTVSGECRAGVPDNGLLNLLHPGSRSAAGIGGDPFLSALDDGVGFWGWPVAVEPRSLNLSIRRDALLERRSPNVRAALKSNETSGRSRVDFSVAGRPALLSAAIVAPDWGTFRVSEDGILSLGNTRWRSSMAFRIENVAPGLTGQASLSASSRTGTSPGIDPGIGVRYRVGSRMTLQAEWIRESLPDVIRSTLHDEPITAALNLVSDRYRAEARLSLPFFLRLEGSHSSGRFANMEERDPTSGYQVLPRGGDRRESLTLGWSRSGTSLLGRWTGGRLDLKGDATDRGRRFGTLDYVHMEIRSVLIGAETWLGGSKRFLLDFESAHARARTRAELESWPFTEAIVDLLGSRRIFKATADIRWTRWHAALDLPAGRHVRGRLGLNAYDLWPRASSLSWTPAVLGFGRTNEHGGSLETFRLQLVNLSAGVSWRIGVMEMSGTLDQPLYAKSFERSGDPGAGDPAPSGSAGSMSGGSRMVVSIARRF